MRTILLGLATFSMLESVRAEDAGSIAASLNDPRAECRYLAEKTYLKNVTLSASRLAIDEWIAAHHAALAKNAQGKKFEEKLAAVERANQVRLAAGRIFQQAQADVATVQSVILARRGTLDQCQSELLKVQPPKDIPK